ncbi:MAG TPA: hypothetical protein VLI72_10220 [Methylibium sp.]|nr:hypothetical protein [Methylibium sp.]
MSSCAVKARHAAPHAERRESVAAPRHGPQALRTALQDVVGEIAGADAARSEASANALHDFTGALSEALRTEGGREVGHGPGRHVQRGYAWGRQGGGDLAQRIEALATRLAGAAAPGEAVTADAADAPVAAPTDAPPVTDTAVDTPAAPLADAAAVPTAPSALEASFAALWQTLQPTATAGTDGTAVDLIGFLHTLAQRLGAAAAPAVGSLVDTTA